jgi:hypothetical protein
MPHYILKYCYMFRLYWTIFRQHTIKNEIDSTVSLSIVIFKISCYYCGVLRRFEKKNECL